MRKISVFAAVTVLFMVVFAGPSCAKDSALKNSPEITADQKKEIEKRKQNVREAKKLVIAKVNGESISMNSLVRTMNMVAPKYIKRGEEVTPQITEKVKKEALERVIFEEMAVQEAIRQGINPQTEEIDKVVSNVKESLGSEEAYKQYLDSLDFTEKALRKQIVRGQRFDLIVAREVYNKVKVDEKLVREAYEKEKSTFVTAEKFEVDDVYFLGRKVDKDTRKKAKEVLKKIKDNNNDPWKLVLDGTFVVREIKIKRNRYPEIHEKMQKMEVDELSGIIKDKDGFHIIKVKKKEPSRQLTLEEARSYLENKFRAQAQQQRKKEWEEELKKTAKIEILLDEVEKKLKENQAATKQEQNG